MSKNSQQAANSVRDVVESAPELLRGEVSKLLSTSQNYKIERALYSSCKADDKDVHVVKALLKPFHGFKKRFEDVEDYTKCLGNSDMLTSLIVGKIRIAGEVFKHHKSDQSQDKDVINRRGKELLFLAFPGYDGGRVLAWQSDLVKSDILAATKAYSVIEKLCEISCEKNPLVPQSSPASLGAARVVTGCNQKIPN